MPADPRIEALARHLCGPSADVEVIVEYGPIWHRGVRWGPAWEKYVKRAEEMILVHDFFEKDRLDNRP
jgi:hypothetical protein